MRLSRNERFEARAAEMKARMERKPPAKADRRYTAPPRPAPIPTLVTDPWLQRCLQDVKEGRVMTFKQIASTTGLSKETVRQIFRSENGVARIRTEYRVPICVFDKVMMGFLVKKAA